MRKFILKFNNSSPAIKATTALLIANMVLNGLSLISGPIFTRIMTSNQYGIVSTFTSWQGVLSSVITLNLSAGVFNNGMRDFKEDRDTFEFSLLILSTISALIWTIVFILLKELFLPLFELPELSIYLMLLYFLFVPAYSLWGGRQRYEYKYKALSIITILIAIVSLAGGVMAVLLSSENNTALSRILFMEGTSISVGIFFFGLIGFKARFRIKKDYCIYALRFNVPLIPHYLSMYVLSSSDKIMITKMVNSSATAIYSVAYTVASVMTIVWQSIEASLSPWIYEELDKKNESLVKKISFDIILLFAGMSVFCTLLAPEIMTILAPKEYSSGIYVIPPIIVGVFFTVIYSLYMRIELFYKQTGFATLATTVAALLNILLNYVFIQLLGPIAAGYTTMASYAILAIMHYINTKRRGYSHIINNKGFFDVSMGVIAGVISISLIYVYPIIRFSLFFLIIILTIWKRKRIMSLFKVKNMNK